LLSTGAIIRVLEDGTRSPEYLSIEIGPGASGPLLSQICADSLQYRSTV